MKVLNKYNLVLALVFFAIPLFANSWKADNEKTKEIVKEFDVTANSDVYFKHRRGTLQVKYIDGNKGKIEALVSVKGDNLEDIQVILDAMSIGVENVNGRIEIKTGDNIKSWSSHSSLFSTKHKIVLDNGKEVTSKVDEVSINATLYLPKVRKLSLNSRYDDVYVESCQVDYLEADIHAATFRAEDLNSETFIKIKYGKIDLKQTGDLKIESHDSKGTIGNIGRLNLKDKYSDLTFGNMVSLDAQLHDGNFSIGNVNEDANIIDKYSVIKLGNMRNGNWNIHDGKIVAGTTGQLTIVTKYTDYTIESAEKMNINSHDDEFTVTNIKSLHVIDSKYTEFKIGSISKSCLIDASHDDNFTINKVENGISDLTFNGKYTGLKLPLPTGLGFSIDALTKYGGLKYPQTGFNETRYVERNSELELAGTSGSGSELKIVLRGHDCNINLE